jgi:hypothetical protein
MDLGEVMEVVSGEVTEVDLEVVMVVGLDRTVGLEAAALAAVPEEITV